MGSAKHSNDATRAERKAKKRKLEDAIPDLPGDVDGREETENVALGEEKSLKKRKRGADKVDQDEHLQNGDEEKAAKKKRKEKKNLNKDLAAPELEQETGVGELDESRGEKRKKSKGVEDVSKIDNSVVTASEEDALPKKSKKERKAKKIAAEAAENSTAQSAFAKTNGTPVAAAIIGEQKPKKNNRNREKKRNASSEQAVPSSAAKAPRFIVFIGNLPFSATTESIMKHFAAVKPASVRHLTQKDDPSKSKGCAFVEFDGFDHMKTCLKLFHHSVFDDGTSPARKINVELTAGGGGNTKDRKKKIEGKNQKLNEERLRRIQEEEKAKGAKRDAGAVEEAAVHPSRRGRVPGA